MMDIEKLIDRLYTKQQSYNSYTDSELAHVMEDAITALSTLKAENEKLRGELERMKKIMRENGIMVISSKYPGGPAEWNIPKPRGQKED